eukprot:2616186-Pyramimonas_sp.AAC.2
MVTLTRSEGAMMNAAAKPLRWPAMTISMKAVAVHAEGCGLDDAVSREGRSHAAIEGLHSLLGLHPHFHGIEGVGQRDAAHATEGAAHEVKGEAEGALALLGRVGRYERFVRARHALCQRVGCVVPPACHRVDQQRHAHCWDRLLLHPVGSGGIAARGYNRGLRLHACGENGGRHARGKHFHRNVP